MSENHADSTAQPQWRKTEPLADPLVVLKTIFTDFPTTARERGRITEADTRANILDRIFHEVLLWPRTSVKREPYANPGFVDYLVIHGNAVLLAEAKSRDVAFQLPFKKKRARRVRLDGADLSDSEVQSAIRQAQRYASDCGARYAIATNGYTFIVFRALVDGTSWHLGEAILFEDLKDLIEHFVEFHNLLSWDSIVSGSLDREFKLQHTSPRASFRPLDNVISADATYGRNPFSTHLKHYVEKFFGDIAGQDTLDVLKKCYVPSEPIQVIDDNLRMVLQDNLPAFAFGGSEAAAAEHNELAFNNDVFFALKDGSGSGRFVLLMGGIGSGKSTFCRRFFRLVVPSFFEQGGRAVLFYLNFLGAPEDPPALEHFLWQRIAEECRSRHPDVLTRDILEEVFVKEIGTIKEIFGKHTESAKEEVSRLLYASVKDDQRLGTAVLNYFSAHGKLPVIVFDNADQLQFETQTALFSAAQRFATLSHCFSILVLREESYSAALFKRHLTASSIRPYHLSAPRLKDLLSVRVDTSVKEAIEAAKAGSANRQDILYAHIVEVFRLLKKAILDKNKNIARLIESLAYGNMRLGLALFNNFITSGATNMEKILEVFAQDSFYSVPFHEFAKSVILGDYRYYRQSRSLVLNVFELSPNPNSSHFTVLRVLAYLEAFQSGSAGDGFCELASMIRMISDVFQNEEDLKWVIERRLITVDRQLVELDTRRTDSLDGATRVRITTSGSYYIHYLSRAFAYLDLVWQDTPITDQRLAEELTKSIEATEMDARFGRVASFLEYLDGEEKRELAVFAGGREPAPFLGPFVPGIADQVEREKAEIRRKLQRRRRGNSSRETGIRVGRVRRSNR